MRCAGGVCFRFSNGCRRLAENANRNGRQREARRGSPAAYLGMGNQWAEVGRLDHAMAQYRKALAIDPQCAEAYNNLGVILHRQGRLDEAAAAYGQALALVPNDAEGHLNLGNVRFAQKALDLAEDQYRRAVSLSPDLADVRLNLGVVLLHQGRLEEALAETLRAVALAPERVEGHQNLGVILVRLDRLEEALTSYQRALTLHPDHAETLMNVGVALTRLGRLEEAVERLRRALALDSENPRIHSNLGDALLKWADAGSLPFKSGRWTAAAACYRQVVAAQPKDPVAYYNLGVVLLQLDQLEEAVSLFEQALRLRPADAESLNNLGVALFRLGRFDEAAACYRQALALKPEYVEARFNQSEVKRFTRGDPDLAALETLAAESGRMSPSQAVHLHFALGKALEDVGDFQRAFEHLLQGNAARRRLLPYDEAAVLGRFRRMAELFDASLFERFQGCGEESNVPIFIVGMPRSGSTLVEQILASHPEIYGAGELTDLADVAQNGPDGDLSGAVVLGALLSQNPACFARLGRAYLARLPALPAGRTRITDKMPDNFMLIGLIHLMLPQARIIHTMRDPVDTCVSCFSKLFTEAQDYSFDLAELGRYYRSYHGLMAHWRRVLPPGRLLEISYESLVDDLEGHARRLIAYCGLPWDERCLAFHETQRAILTASATQVRQPLFRGSIGRWRRYRPFLQPLLAALESVLSDGEKFGQDIADERVLREPPPSW